MNLQIIPREVQVLDPNLSITQRIATMARICYKNETDPSEEADLRIIRTCISRGHESILEHGIISLFVNPELTEDSKSFAKYTQSKQPYSFDILWRVGETDASNKYIEHFNDPDIYKKWCKDANVAADASKTLPCYVGDVRAWRQVVRERFFLSSQHGDVSQFILTIKILNELNTIGKDNVLFGDIVNDINEVLQDEKSRNRLLTNDCKLDTYSVKTVSDFYFQVNNTIFAYEASSSASLSVIIVTDRAVTHEHVRHRKNVAYSQESQRYVNYGKRGCRVTPFIIDPVRCPEGIKVDPITGLVLEDQEAAEIFMDSITHSFNAYEKLLALGCPPESARLVLPEATATKIGVTWMRQASYTNFNFWRLDNHAWFNIRSAAFNVVYQAFKMKHPFTASIPHDIAMQWLHSMIDQKIMPESANIEAIIKDREMLHQSILKMLEGMQKKQQ